MLADVVFLSKKHRVSPFCAELSNCAISCVANELFDTITAEQLPLLNTYLICANSTLILPLR